MDLTFGDPPWFPHPVRIIGWTINKLEILLRRCFSNLRFGGLVLAITIIAASFCGTWAIIKIAGQIHPSLSLVVSTFLIYTTLSVKDLGSQSMKVYKSLQKTNLVEARKSLSNIVGRDTQGLDDKEIIRATVETVAENTVDGIISPLFYAFLGGAPLAMAYKGINTLDSMVGYKNEKYRHFGWASARIDDMANFIPARITGLLLTVAAWLCGKNGLRGLRTMWHDGQKNPSPNSGIPEAAMAGALGIRLGGLNFYAGQPTMKPYLGTEERNLDLSLIKDSIHIMHVCTVLAVALGLVPSSI